MSRLPRLIWSCPCCPKNFRTAKELIKHLELRGSEYFIPKVKIYPERFKNQDIEEKE